MALVGLLFGENIETYFQRAEALRTDRDAQVSAAAERMQERKAAAIPNLDLSPGAPEFEHNLDLRIEAMNRLGHDPELRRDEAALWAARENYTQAQAELLDQTLPADGNLVVRTARLIAKLIG